MTVYELIEELKKLPPSTKVVLQTEDDHILKETMVVYTTGANRDYLDETKYSTRGAFGEPVVVIE